MGTYSRTAVKPIGQCGVPARPRGHFAHMLAWTTAYGVCSNDTAVRLRGPCEGRSG